MSPARRFPALSRRLRVVLAIAVASLALFFGTAGPAAAKDCAEAPFPNRPITGISGSLAPKNHADAFPGDPFDNPSIAISDVYGYSYRWATYDTGCAPGSGVGPDFQNSMGNFVLTSSAAVNAVTHNLLVSVVDPSWLEPLDSVTEKATNSIKSAFWDPWIGVTLLLVAVFVLWSATKADMPRVVTITTWALTMLVGGTFLMTYPAQAASGVDDMIRTSVLVPAQIANSDSSSASAALTSQIDQINRETLYGSWLQGYFGDSESATALAYGPDLFRSSHLTWWEMQTVDRGGDEAKELLNNKKKLWEETTKKIEEVDAGAYRQVTGHQGRWDAILTSVILTLATMPFLIVAAAFIFIAYAAIRVLIPIAPGLFVFGLIEPLRGWVEERAKDFARFLVLGPLFWMGALVNMLITSSIMQSSMALAIKIGLAVAVPYILFKLLKPKGGGPRMPRFGSGKLTGSVPAIHDKQDRSSSPEVSKSDSRVAEEEAPTRRRRKQVQASDIESGASRDEGRDGSRAEDEPRKSGRAGADVQESVSEVRRSRRTGEIQEIDGDQTGAVPEYSKDEASEDVQAARIHEPLTDDHDELAVTDDHFEPSKPSGLGEHAVMPEYETEDLSKPIEPSELRLDPSRGVSNAVPQSVLTDDDSVVVWRPGGRSYVHEAPKVIESSYEVEVATDRHVDLSQPSTR